MPRSTAHSGAKVAGMEGVAGSVPQARFIKGPNQRLADIATQRGQLSGVADQAHRGRISGDLDRAERNAKRSILLDQRRRDNPEVMQGPGLLELFGSLNSLVGNLRQGNAVGAVKELTRGIRMLGDTRPGGLNIAQKLSRAGLNGVNQSAGPSLGDFALNGIGQAGKGVAGAEVAGVAEAGAVSVGEAVGGTAAAVGGSAFAGQFAIIVAGFAIVIGGVVTAFKLAESVIKMFSAGVKQGLETISTAAAAVRNSGGTASQINQLGAYGLQGEQLTGIAAAFRQEGAAGTGSVDGQIARAQLGLGPVLSGPHGPLNEAKDLLQAIDGLRAVAERAGGGDAGRSAQLRVTRMSPSLAPLLPIAQSSAGVYASVQKDAAARKMLDRKGITQDQTDLQVNQGRLFGNIAGDFQALMQPVIRPLADFFGTLADIAREAMPLMGKLGGIGAGIMKVVNSVLSVSKGVFEALLKSPLGKMVSGAISQGINAIVNTLTSFAKDLPGIVIGIAKAVKGMAPVLGFFGPALGLGSNFGKDLASTADEIIKSMEALSVQNATKAQVAALDRNTAAVKHASGTYGAGERARGALGPQALRGSGRLREAAIEAHAISLGYWTL